MFVIDNIDLEQSENYLLTLRISPSSFSFYIENKSNKMDHYYGEKQWGEDTDVLVEIQQIIFDNNFFTLPYYKTSVVIVSNRYEFVPNYLLEKAHVKSLYNFTHIVKSERVLQVSITTENITTLFDIDEELYKFLSRSLFNPQFYHHTPLILSYIKQNIKPTTDNSWVVMNCHESFVDVFYFNRTQSLRYNVTLKEEKDVDCLYYIMNFWNKLNLSQETDLLYIISNPDSVREALFNSLKRYIRNVHMVGFANDYNPLLEYNEKSPFLDFFMIKDIV